MLEFDFHGGGLATSLNYVVGYLKTYKKKTGLGPFWGYLPQFLGPALNVGHKNGG